MFKYHKLIVTNSNEKTKQIIDSYKGKCESISYSSSLVRLDDGLITVRNITSFEKAKEVGCGIQFSSIEFMQPCELDVSSVSYLLSRLQFFNPYCK